MNNIRLTNNRLRSHILTGLFASAFFFGATSVVSAATLSFSPSSAAIVQECQSSININVNISGQSSNAAEVLIAYNPAEITILDSDPVSAGTQVRKGPAYDALLINDVNATTGRIRLVAGSVTNILSSTKTIATIEFLSNPGVSATSLSFFFAGVGVTNSSNDSNIADYTTSNDILTGVTNGSYTFYADTCPTTQDITPPQVTFVTPTPDETGVPLNTNIQIRITDAGGIALSSITFLVNNTSYDVNDPEVSYTGTSNDYLFTIDPAADLPAGEEIVVIAIGSDQSNNAFASQMSFNAPPPSGTDTDEPIVEFINPVANASNVPLDSNVSFRITDIGSGTNINTLLFYLNGVLYTSVSPEVSITGTPNNYQITINPTSNFPSNQPVTLVVSGRDLAGNDFLAQMQFNQIQGVLCPSLLPPIITQVLTVPSDELLNNTFLENTIADTLVTQIGVTGTGALVTGVGLGLNLLPFISMLNAPGFLVSFIGMILGRKRGKPWGLIIDAISNKPIAFATCRLYLSGALGIVTQTVSDLEGRYGFVVPPGRYRLEITHTDYEPYKQEITVEEETEYVSDVRLNKKGLTPETGNLWQKTRRRVGHTMRKLSPALFVMGLLFSLVSIIVSFSVLNLIIALAYTLVAIGILVSKFSRGAKRAAVIDSVTNLRIPFAVVKIFDPATWKLVDTQITNNSGQFDFWGNPGTYALLVAVRGYNFPSKKQKDLKPIAAKYNTLLNVKLTKGNNHLQIFLDPVTGSNQRAENFQNPFA